MDKKQVRYGIVGIGKQGTFYTKIFTKLSSLVKGAKLTAVCDISPERRKYAEENLKGVKVFDNYQDMFESCDAKLPDEYAYGMKLVEMGPSAVNRRPVKFRYENGVLSGSVDEPYSDKSVDFGIAKLHFVLGVRAKGINGKWNYENVFEQTQAQRIMFESKKDEDDCDE